MSKIDLTDFIPVQYNGKDYPNYMVNPATTKILNVKKMKVLTQFRNNPGYKSVSLYNQNGFNCVLVHRLIYASYNKCTIPKGMVIDHKNNEKENNNINNLQLVSHSYNIKKDYKYCNTRPRQVISIDIENKTEIMFKSLSTASKMLNVNRGQIRLICKGQCKTATNKKTGKKYTFKYIEP